MSKTATYSLINSTTLGSAQSSVTFSSIPSTFTDLVIVCQTSAASGTQANCIRFNGDTSSNYGTVLISADGSTARAVIHTSASSLQIGYDDYNTSAIGMMNIINIQDYANSTTYKTVIARGSNANVGVSATVGVWLSTNTISSVTVLTKLGTNYSTGSTFKLYGIEAGNL